MVKTKKNRLLPRYKEKECPVCKKLHHNRIKYCSISCSNRGRTVTNKHKAKTSASMIKFYQSPEGTVVRKNMTNYNKGIAVVRQEDIDIIPPFIDFDLF